MLVNMTEMLLKAKESNYAIPQFNINNLEWTRFILEECQKHKSPVILGVSEGAAKYMGGYNVVYAVASSLVKDLGITVPVALHLDHGTSFENCEKAINAGFTSVMIDASKLSLEENIAITKSVVELAKINNVTVEAEVGHIGGTEDGITAEIAYADLDDCLKLIGETGIFCLAPALGSAHGIYSGEPNLDYERMIEISEKGELPLVLHGGTGIPDDKIQKAIANGINKININTELQLAWTAAVREFLKANDEYDPRKVIKSGEVALKEAVTSKILLFGSNNRT